MPDTADRYQALSKALAHPEEPLEKYILIFHQGCGGVITGTGVYRCDECGRKFSLEELRNLVG